MLFALTRFLECIFVSAVKFPIYPIYIYTMHRKCLKYQRDNQKRQNRRRTDDTTSKEQKDKK